MKTDTLSEIVKTKTMSPNTIALLDLPDKPIIEDDFKLRDLDPKMSDQLKLQQDLPNFLAFACDKLSFQVLFKGH